MGKKLGTFRAQVSPDTLCIIASTLCGHLIISNDLVLLTNTLSIWLKLKNFVKSTFSVLACQPAFHGLRSVNYFYCLCFPPMTCTHMHILTYSSVFWERVFNKGSVRERKTEVLCIMFLKDRIWPSY